jgi:IstB-like ATP binding protein
MTAWAPAGSPAPPQVLLAHHLRQLKLPTFLREYEKLAAEAAREGLDHVRFLLRLAELELVDRERRMVERRIRAARFSVVKSFDTFDFAAIPSLNKPLTLELARCEYLIPIRWSNLSDKGAAQKQRVGACRNQQKRANFLRHALRSGKSRAWVLPSMPACLQPTG